MTPLFATPDLDLEDVSVVAEIHATRQRLASALRTPRRWKGGLRRTAQARAIQGSNTIEGYTVTEQDAVAAVDDDPPLSTDQRTWAEILGYRRVLAFVLTVARTPGFTIDESTLRSMHFMLLEHDLSKSPGSYRPGEVYLPDDRSGRTVYQGPDAADLASLMNQLADRLAEPEAVDPLVRGAMAHLNLVMIHPFKDGNGRMARALQTMVQAQTVERRFEEAAELWNHIDELLVQHTLEERQADALFDALLGLRVTRPSYVRRAEVEDRTATRDLRRLVDTGLLVAHGQTRGRYYLASPRLAGIRREVRNARPPVTDPFPSLLSELQRISTAAT